MILVRRTVFMLTATVLSAATLVAVAPAAQAVVAPPEPTTLTVDNGNSLIIGPSGALQGSGETSQLQLGSPSGSYPEGLATSLRTLAPLPDGATAVAIESITGGFVVVADNGKVYGVGANSSGQLSSLATTVTSWTELPGLPTGDPAPKAIDVSTSQGCTLVLLDDGRVFRTGENYGGECPVTGTNKKLLTEMPGLTGKAVDIAISRANPNDDHTVVLLDDGTLWGTGDNYFGQLVGTIGDQTALTQLSAIASVTPTAVAAHAGDTYVIGADGQAYGAGANIARQLTGTQALSVTSWRQLSGLPVDVEAAQVVGFGNGSAVLGDDDKLYVTGNVEMFDPAGVGLPLNDILQSSNVGALTLAPQPATMGTVKAIDANGGNLIARDHRGYVWGVGNNFYGQLTGTDNPINGFTVLDGQGQASVTAPIISGAGVYGSAFTATNGAWHIPPTSYAYQWLRNGAPIAGANATSYVPQREDTGSSLAVSVTALTTGVPNVTTTSAAAGIANQLFNTVRPVIKGKAKKGKKLSFTHRGGWNVPPTAYSYRWLRNGIPIYGATKSTYKLKKADKRKNITLRVTAGRPGFILGVADSSNAKRFK